MGLFKCKMCGAELPVTEGAKIVECEYCGTSQTIATSNDDKILKLYARGNLLRTQNEFDKAYSIFEQIVAENPKDAEAYWNLLLCKYGVTYVDDYDGSKKPTISRMSMTSIKEDVDYKNVIEYADEATKKVYEKQINEISLIQENILNIVKKEKPYDIFISYKETDEFGDRTEDSVLAQDIYDALTKEGYKVFLSRITLSGVIGSEYEPYIYSALYSSKVMLLVTTSEEYVNAVWVKNEWSRFLKMMKEDSSKKLIPCFKTIDAYDLPKEVRNIQSVNFDKLGAIQDLIIGVNKILGKQEEADKTENSKIDNLLKRAKIYIEDTNFDKAIEVLEKVLDEDAECAEAYMLMFMANFKINSIEKALLIGKMYPEDQFYSKVIQYASKEYKEKLDNILKEKNIQDAEKIKVLTSQEKMPKNIFDSSWLFNISNVFDDKYNVKDSLVYKGVSIDGMIIEKNDYNGELNKIVNERNYFVEFQHLISMILYIHEKEGKIKLITYSLMEDFILDEAPGEDLDFFSVNLIDYVMGIKEICQNLFPLKKCEFVIKNDNFENISYTDAYMIYKRIILEKPVPPLSPSCLTGFYLENQNITLTLEKDKIKIEGVYKTIVLYVSSILKTNIRSVKKDNKHYNYFDIYYFNNNKKYTILTLYLIAESDYFVVNKMDNNKLNEENILLKEKFDELLEYLLKNNIPTSKLNFDTIDCIKERFGKENYVDYKNFDFSIVQNNRSKYHGKLLYELNNLIANDKKIKIKFYENKILYENDGKITEIEEKNIIYIHNYLLDTPTTHGYSFDLWYRLDNTSYTKIQAVSLNSNGLLLDLFTCKQQYEEVQKCIKIMGINKDKQDRSTINIKGLKYINTGVAIGGCYVATCVYGSYDCPEVWSLRRYRDNYLDSFLLGRLFIKLYYKVSPKLVELFGDKEWFRKPIKKILNKKINKLKEKGYEDTPYNDKY